MSDLSADPLKLLWCGGLHPSLSRFWSTFFTVINVFLCCFFTSLAIQGVLISYNSDLFFMAECLQTCILMIHGVGIFSIVRIQRNSLKQLLQDKANFWGIENFDGELHESCSNLVKIVKHMLRYYYGLNTFVCIFFDLQPLATGNLPSTCYVPEGWFNYLTVLLWYLSVVVLLGFPGTDSFFCSLATSLVVQFKLLSYKFKTLQFTDDELISKTWNELKHLVDYHNFLLRYSEKLSSTFQGIFVLQFLISIASGAVSVFIFMQPGAWLNRIKFLLYFVATMIESAFYCVPLEYVVNEASQIGNSLYETEWNKIKCVQLKRGLTLILVRAQKFLSFSAYGLIVINLQTYIVICKTMVSFYTYLNSVKKL